MRLAITGGVAEGKSAVLSILASLGWPTASSDDLAREIFARPDVQSEIAEELSLEVPVTPEAVKKRIWRDPKARRSMNGVTHPRIIESILGGRFRAVEVPLLIETCTQGLFDQVWVVACGPAEQLRRLTERTGDADEARQIIASQLPTEAKLAFADAIVRTNEPVERVNRFVTELAKRVDG